jgi:CheY-like chemotaxis protein
MTHPTSRPGAASCEIIVVEDNDDIRQFIVEFVRREFPSCTIHEAAEGHAALRLLRALDRPPCLVLLDLMMPGMNGSDLLDVLRADDVLSAIPVTVMSASDVPASGAHHRLRKPFPLESLRPLVERYCAGG